MKSNLMKQMVKPWVSKLWPQANEAEEKILNWTEASAASSQARASRSWPEILPPQMDDRYFNQLRNSIIEKIKEKRTQTDY